jgi:hypothetical protein
MEKNVSFVLTQENDSAFYLRGGFEFSGSVEEASSEMTFRVIKFMERVKKFRMKTNFKFGKKFTIDMTIDGKTYRSTDLYFAFDDSGKDCNGAITLSMKRSAIFMDLVQEMIEG